MCNELINQRESEYSMNHFGKELCRDCQCRRKSMITQNQRKLYDELTKNHIKCELEVYDGSKHVDIAIERAKLYIEIDEEHHLTNPNQLYSDIKRDYYSWKDGYYTIRIPSERISKDLEGIVTAIKDLILRLFFEEQSEGWKENQEELEFKETDNCDESIKDSENLSADREKITEINQNPGEIIVSKDVWMKLSGAHNTRDKKRRRDYAKDGGSY